VHWFPLKSRVHELRLGKKKERIKLFRAGTVSKSTKGNLKNFLPTWGGRGGLGGKGDGFGNGREKKNRHRLVSGWGRQ